ncbi:phage tail protein [Phaeobacter italicus]|uniref:phage tail protein n=2 Tax=Phaeobacter italicus TaxID=481446 RepID=UPI002FD9D43F
MKHLFLAALMFLLASSGPADAAPVIAAFQAVAAFVGTLGVVGSALLQLAIGSAMSMIAKAKMRRAQRENSGIQTEVTLTGGTNSESFILGYYGTAGTWVCPPLSRGDRLKILTYVIDLAGMPGHSLEEVFVNGEKLELDGKIKHGETVSSKEDSFKGLVTVTYFDGSQTKAPVMMQSNYGADPDFPWTAEMVGRGRCYVIVEFEFDNKVFSGLPRMRFGMRGVPLLDPRDGSVGQSDNLALLAYSVLRGFNLPDGSRWGGEASLDDLPLSVWAAAMNEADRLIETKDGESERQFRGGFEVRIGENEPAEVLERLMDACTGDLAEEGGTWYVRMGAPPVPSAFLTDDDLIVDAPMSLTPFAGLADSMNSLTLKFPNPAIAWEVSEAERILRPELEAQHEGRRLSQDISLSACPFPLQVQRVGKAYVEDAQRDVLHSFTLPPDFAHLPPLSVVSWTSEHNQYDGKHFSIEKKVIHPHDLLASVELREVDPSDHSWSTDDELPVPDGGVRLTPPVLYILNGVRVAPVDILDSDGKPRRAAIEVSQIPSVEGVEWRVFDFTGVRVADGVAMDVGDAFLITQGILPGHTYFVSLRVADEVNVDWSAWYEVSTNDVRVGPDDLSDEVWQYVDGVAISAVNSFTGNMTYALEKLSEVDLENRVAGFLETARVEGVVDEKTEALSSEVEGVRAELVQNYVTAATQDAALATLQTSLSAQIAGVSATLSTSYYTISQVNSAISAARTALQSEISGVSATLSADYYTIAQTDSAISAATTSVTSSVDTLTTTVSQVQSSVDGITGTYGVQVNNNGVVTGFGLVSELINGSVTTTFTVQADRFVIASSSGGAAMSPFLISGGKVYLRDAVIKDASIQGAKIKALAVDTLHIKGKAVDTRQIAENAATTFYEATGGTGYKRIQINNTHDEPITLIIIVLYDCLDDGGSSSLFAGVEIYKEQTAGGKNNLLSLAGDSSSGGGEVAEDKNTEVVTTTINPGITRWITAYPLGRVVRRCDMIILQRQR